MAAAIQQEFQPVKVREPRVKNDFVSNKNAILPQDGILKYS
jgi:hypothetical protein